MKGKLLTRVLIIMLIGCFSLLWISPTYGQAKGRGQPKRSSTNATAEPQPPQIDSAILMDADTGEVLFEKDPHKKRPPASMVKMMLMLIAAEKVASGALHLSDEILTSSQASRIGGSQVYLKQGEVFTLEELMKAIVVHSANDASYAIAEHIAGSVEGFVDLMNQRGKELGLKETHFMTVHGLPPEPGQQPDLSTAYDLALLGREVVKHPVLLEWGSIKEDSFRDGKFVLTNTNKLLISFQGADGIKTGSYHEAGFNITATAKRDGVRMIAVVMGAPNGAIRFAEAKKLLAMGFNSYKRVLAIRKDTSVGPEIPVRKSTIQKIKGIAAADLVIRVKKGEEKEVVPEFHLPDAIEAPTKKGQPIGEVVLKHQDKVLGKVALISPEEILRVGFLGRLFKW
ncbi:MAG: D-alanyl-D-alanine carboxypeptidase [Candidatus Tectomicrobia bacterium]|nr:D-alanyl-D-alanine carboxypeptidase [Candidatus Tectomicrobia bacterium]